MTVYKGNYSMRHIRVRRLFRAFWTPIKTPSIPIIRARKPKCYNPKLRSTWSQSQVFSPPYQLSNMRSIQMYKNMISHRKLLINNHIHNHWIMSYRWSRDKTHWGWLHQFSRLRTITQFRHRYIWKRLKRHMTYPEFKSLMRLQVEHLWARFIPQSSR